MFEQFDESNTRKPCLSELFLKVGEKDAGDVFAEKGGDRLPLFLGERLQRNRAADAAERLVLAFHFDKQPLEARFGSEKGGRFFDGAHVSIISHSLSSTMSCLTRPFQR